MNSGRVLLISPYFRPNIGGIENHVFELATRLSKYLEVDVLTIGTAFKYARIGGRVSIRSVRPWCSPMNNPFTPTLLFHAIKSNSSIIHVHGIYQSTLLLGFLAARITGRQILVSMHGRPYYESKLKRWLQKVIEKTILGLLLRRLDNVVVSTPSDHDFLLTLGVKRENVSLIPNATNTSFWSSHGDISGQQGLESERFLLFVGALTKRKNCGIVLDAFQQLMGRFQDIVLIIVGEGPCKSTLLEQSETLGISGNVVFKHHIGRSRLRELYVNAAALVHPSRMEGLPTVLLEAMSAGTVVISSDIDAVKSLIEDGRNGILFDVGNLESLVEVLERVLALPEEEKTRITGEARTTILKQYSWEVTVRDIAQLYLKLVPS